MTPEAYTLIQDRLVTMAHFVRNMDLPAFILKITTSQKAAPILNPDIYTDLKDYQAVKDVAQAALDFKTRIESIKREWRRRHSRRVLKGEDDGE